jgi:hypothetical protein
MVDETSEMLTCAPVIERMHLVRHARSDTLDELEPLLAELRALPGIRERTRGAFYRGSSGFLHFHEDPAGLFADVKLEKGGAFKRVEVTTATQRARLLGQVRAALG